MSQTKSRNTHSSRQQSPLFIHTLSSHLDGLVFGLQEKTEIDASVCVCVQIKAPVLLMLGGRDRRVTPHQGLELYRALKSRASPVR